MRSTGPACADQSNEVYAQQMQNRHSRPPQRKAAFAACVIALATICAARGAENTDLSVQLAKFRATNMPYDTSTLSARQKKLVAKLVEASHLLERVYWEQSDPAGLKLYQSLAGSTRREDQDLRRFIMINGGRYDLIAEHAPFGGAGARPPGANLYPADLTRGELDAYVAQHPEQREALYSPYTVVRRKGSALVTIPYHVAYRQWVAPMSKALREAAALSDDAAFAKFLRLRADALLTDDYYESDVAWLAMTKPQFDVIFGPYETYLDDLLGVKTSYGAAVLIRDDSESKLLEVFQKFVPQIQDALPLNASDRPSKQGLVANMQVMQTPLRSGDLRHGYQAVADNLPNDAKIHEQHGSKGTFFKNFMDARVQYIVLPMAQTIMDPEQARLANPTDYLTFVMMHEISHGIGPAFARTAAGRRDIREAIGPTHSALEEAKADVLSLFGVKWLVDHGSYPRDQLHNVYSSRVADIYRTVRFGVAEAHGRADIMQFNYFVEHGAVKFDAASGRYRIDFTTLPGAIESLARELLEQEATGDRARAEAWFERYGKIPAELNAALARAQVPVDIDPHFELE